MAAEPAKFLVPSTELPGLRLLAHEDTDILERIVNQIKDEPPSIDAEPLTKSISEKAQIGIAQVQSVVSLLWRWAIVQRRLELSTEEFVSGLTRNLAEMSLEKWNEDDRAHWDTRVGLVTRLLAPDSAIAAGAKAGELLLDQPLVFCSSRVITDFRPVFDDPATTVRGMVPFHTLVIRCHESEEFRDLHVAMDFNDVMSLHKQLERAEQKERVVRSLLVDAGITVINTGSNAED